MSDESELPLTGWNTAVALLDTIPGVNRRIAEVMLAEMGLDMSQLSDGWTHLASWAGLAPGNYQSGGKRYSGRTTKGNKISGQHHGSGLPGRQSRTKDTFLKARYHRLAARRGKKRAIVAVAHSMLVSAWHMLTYQTAISRTWAATTLTSARKSTKVNYLVRRLEKLTGGSVSIEIQPTAA